MTCTYLAKRLRELSSTKTGSYPHEFLSRTNCSACADYQPCYIDTNNPQGMQLGRFKNRTPCSLRVHLLHLISIMSFKLGHVSIPKRRIFLPLFLFCAYDVSVLQNFKIFTHLLWRTTALTSRIGSEKFHILIFGTFLTLSLKLLLVQSLYTIKTPSVPPSDSTCVLGSNTPGYTVGDLGAARARKMQSVGPPSCWHALALINLAPAMGLTLCFVKLTNQLSSSILLIHLIT